MASETGSNPESSEPVFNLETQLDDLLEQIDKAQPGLNDAAAPTSHKSQDDPQDDPQDEMQGELDEDEPDLQGDFETVETVDHATARKVSASYDQTQGSQNEPKTADPFAVADQTGQASQSDEDDTDAQDDDDDDLAFSPEDFVTTEQATNTRPIQRAEPEPPVDTDAADQLEQMLATPVREHAAAATDQHRPGQTTSDEATSDEAAWDHMTLDDDPDDLLGLDLASQIQQLLDDARTDDNPNKVSDEPVEQPAVATSEPVDDAIADVDADVDTDDSSQEFDASMFETTQETLLDSEALQETLDAVAQTLETDETQAVDEAVDELADESALSQPVIAEGGLSSEPESYAPNQDAAAMSLDDIDQMLADEADEALAGDFETTSDVIAEASTPKAEADANAQAMDAEADDELDFAGSFETTQEIITQEADGSQHSQNQGLSAGAQAVARELDEQPENQHAGAADASSARDAGTLTMPGGKRGMNLSGLAAFTRVPDVARQVCTTISRPMEAVAPQTRDLVGYIGLITLFWGTVTLIVKFIFAVSH